MNGEKWCQPISEGSFGGAPSRSEESYDLMLVELGKLDSLHGAVCNWDRVFEVADALTRQKTKDMTVLGALTVALYKREKWSGLASALQAYAWLVQNHSSDLFPNAQRLRGRAGAYSWLTERLTRELETAAGSGPDHEALLQCLESLKTLDGSLREQLADLHPRVQPLIERLAELVEATRPPPPPPPAPEPPPAPPEAPVAAAPAPSSSAPQRTSAQAAAPAAALPGEITSLGEARNALDQVERVIRALARFHLQQDPASALGYQLGHICSFLGVLPDGVRRSGAPSDSRQGELREMVSQQRWADLLGLVPQILDESDLDLETERCIGAALEGAGHQHALATVNAMALGTHRMLHELLALDDSTAAWLQGLGGSGGESSGGDGARAAADPLDGVVAQARAGAQQSLEAGCGIIQAAIRREGSRAGRFRLQLALANLWVEGDAPELAWPILRHLYQELDGPAREWLPDMVIRVAVAMLDCFRQLDRQRRAPADAEVVVDQLLAVLSQIDPQTALRERDKNRA